MGGQTTFQRSTMTANLGTYYLDTSVSLTTQNNEKFTVETPINVNVFQGGQTYFMYFLYTQPNTQQTYQIYVGPGFDLTTDLQGMRSLINALPMAAADITLSPTLPTGWTAHYNDSTACAGFSSNNCGILQVTTNFSALTMSRRSRPMACACPTASAAPAAPAAAAPSRRPTRWPWPIRASSLNASRPAASGR